MPESDTIEYLIGVRDAAYLNIKSLCSKIYEENISPSDCWGAHLLALGYALHQDLREYYKLREQIGPSQDEWDLPGRVATLLEVFNSFKWRVDVR